MPVSIRERVIEAFADLLRGVTPDSGAQVDLSGSVFTGRSVFGREDGQLVVSVVERADQDALANAAPEKSDSGYRISDLPLVVQGFCVGSDNSYTVASDVVRAIVMETQRGGRQRDLLGLKAGSPTGASPVEELLVGQPLVRPSEETRGAHAEFWLQVTVRFVEDRINPFAWG